AVVIGGGLLGIETAYGLSRAGVPVTLIHLMDRLMERQLDAEGGRLLAGALQARGISVRLKASTDRIEDDGTGSVSGITLKDGRSIPAAAVIMAVGVRANTQLATGAGLTVERGIVVADDLSTSCPGMYAIGECAQHDGSVYGLVEPGYDQARILAQHLTGDDGGAYTGNVLSTNLKVSGVPVFSAGDFSDEAAQSIITRDPAHNAYRRFFIKDDRLVGTVLVGDTGDALWYRDLIADQTDISDMRDNLAFGRTFAQAA
ncbi:MAG: FAD-dependent oxidoreductase, partial [Pseudomonadota bacterium]